MESTLYSHNPISRYPHLFPTLLKVCTLSCRVYTYPDQQAIYVYTSLILIPPSIFLGFVQATCTLRSRNVVLWPCCRSREKLRARTGSWNPLNISKPKICRVCMYIPMARLHNSDFCAGRHICMYTVLYSACTPYFWVVAQPHVSSRDLLPAVFMIPFLRRHI